MSNKNPIPHLQIVTNCPFCGGEYGKEDIKLITRKDDTFSLYLNCKNCKSSMVMLLIMGPMGIASISIPTDITEKDLDMMSHIEPVDGDDVLEMYKFLKSI